MHGFKDQPPFFLHEFYTFMPDIHTLKMQSDVQGTEPAQFLAGITKWLVRAPVKIEVMAGLQIDDVDRIIRLIHCLPELKEPLLNMFPLAKFTLNITQCLID